jgi:hypothetical protein
MLGYFPDIYPGELLYSACARFNSVVKFPTTTWLMRELFGTSAGRATVDLPAHINYLAGMLPPGRLYTCERLLSQHTLLPYYAPFLPGSRTARLSASMRGSEYPGVKMSAAVVLTGIMTTSTPVPLFLQYCWACVQEDRRKFGEAYWHAVHQVPCVKVCHVHSTWLSESAVRARGPRSTWREFVSAETSISRSDDGAASERLGVGHLALSLFDPSHNSLHKLLLQVARDSAWLLEHGRLETAFNNIRQLYYVELGKLGLLTVGRSVRARRLDELLRDCFGEDNLMALHCPLSNSPRGGPNWPVRLLQGGRSGQPPLRHLLIIQFLGYSAEEFFRLPAVKLKSAFGAGPWACLNPAAEHYGQKLISAYAVANRRHETAIFRCPECQFTYRRHKDAGPEDNALWHSGVVSWGPVWTAVLQELWDDETVSLNQMAARLQRTQSGLRKQALELGLPLPRARGLKAQPSEYFQVGRTKDRQAQAELKREVTRMKHRATWLACVQGHLNATVSSLRVGLGREYGWLRQHDSEWFNMHKPKPRAEV